MLARVGHLFLLFSLATSSALAASTLETWIDPDGRPLRYIRSGDMLVLKTSLSKSHWNCFPWSGQISIGANVYYEFADGLDEQRRQYFLEAAGWWARHADLDFISASSGNRIFVEGVEGNVSTSFCGMVGGAQLMRIGEVSGFKTVAHEIGHALGLSHEQNRPDRNNYIDVHLSSIEAAYRDQYDIDGISDGYGVYDFRSIMHYERFDFSIDGAQPAMSSLAGDFCAPASSCNNVMGSGGPFPGGSPGSGYLSVGDITGAVRRYGAWLRSGPVAEQSGDVRVVVGITPDLRETCAADCRVHMNQDELVRLQPDAADGFMFAGWIGEERVCSQGQLPDCVYTVKENVAVRALFLPVAAVDLLFDSSLPIQIFSSSFEASIAED